VAASVGAGGLGLAQLDEGVEVGRLAALAELYGQGGDLTAGIAGVNGQGAPGAGQCLIEPPGVHEQVAEVGVHLQVARIKTQGALQGAHGVVGAAQVAVDQARAIALALEGASSSARAAWPAASAGLKRRTR
jgi:hypothetical protein